MTEQKLSAETPSDQSPSALQSFASTLEQPELMSDRELLELYVHANNRAAVEILIGRYAPMIASVCRLTVHDPSSAEDAFQATLLVFLKSARSIRNSNSVAAWLHGVAYRTSCRIRASSRKQLSNQNHQAGTHIVVEQDPIAELARRSELDALDRELEKLPDRLRQPLIEHYLLGYTAPQIADRMDLSVSAVEGRLRRGRRMLRTRLAMRGVSLSVVVAGAEWFQKTVRASEALDWTHAFCDAQLDADLDQFTTDSSDPTISSLVQGEINMFGTASIKVLAAAGGIALTVGLIAYAVNAGDGPAGNPLGRSAGIYMPAATFASSSVVAQMEGFGGSDGGLGGPGMSGDSGEGGFGNTGGMPGAGGGMASEDKQEPIDWQRPEDSGSVPAWLAGGQASMQAMEKNRAALAEFVEFDFDEVPLSSVVDWLAEQFDTQFELNSVSLSEFAISPDTPITLHGSGSIRELIRRVGEPLDLTYVVTESTIEITSRSDASTRSSLRFYDLSYVLPNSANVNALIDAIQSSITAADWENNGGSQSISVVGSMMIVSAPDATHQTIEVLLLNISQMNPSNASKALSRAVGMGGGMGGMGGGMGGGMF